MLTGELPIGRFAPPSQKVQIDVRLDEVVLRALEKEPERRYQQASEIKTQVETIVTTPLQSGDDRAKPADAAQAPQPGDGVLHADGKDRYWRVFGVPLVGVRDGQRVVHWPGVCLFVAIMVVGWPLAVGLAYILIALIISVASPGPRMGPSPLLLLSTIFLSLALYAGWGLGIVMLIVKIRQGLAAPMKGLPRLDAARSPAPPDSGAKTDMKFNDGDIEQARRQVKGPAIGLLVTGILNWIATPLIVLVLFYIISAKSSNPVSAVGLIPALILNLVFSSLIIFGAEDEAAPSV